MGIIVWLILGGLIGWLASVVMKTNAQMGVIANVVVGVVGSALGFWLAGMIGLQASGTIARGLVSLAGAVALILVLRALKILK